MADLKRDRPLRGSGGVATGGRRGATEENRSPSTPAGSPGTLLRGETPYLRSGVSPNKGVSRRAADANLTRGQIFKLPLNLLNGACNCEN